MPGVILQDPLWRLRQPSERARGPSPSRPRSDIRGKAGILSPTMHPRGSHPSVHFPFPFEPRQRRQGARAAAVDCEKRKRECNSISTKENTEKATRVLSPDSCCLASFGLNISNHRPTVVVFPCSKDGSFSWRFAFVNGKTWVPFSVICQSLV